MTASETAAIAVRGANEEEAAAATAERSSGGLRRGKA